MVGPQRWREHLYGRAVIKKARRRLRETGILRVIGITWEGKHGGRPLEMDLLAGERRPKFGSYCYNRDSGPP